MAFFSIAVDLTSEINSFLETYTTFYLTRTIINFAFVAELCLLLFAYRKWFTSYRREKELSMIIDSINPHALIVVDELDKILLCNRAVQRMFEYEASDVLGQKTDLLFTEMVPKNTDRHGEIESLGKEGFHISLAKGVHKDGRVFPAEVITGNIHTSGGAAILVRDVSERVDFQDKIFAYQNHLEELVRERTTRLEKTQGSLVKEVEEHRRSKEEVLKLSQFLHGVIDNASIWMLVFDIEANIVLWNKAAEEISGYSRDDVLDKSTILQWIFHEVDDAVRIKNRIIISMKDDKEFDDFETVITAKNGAAKVLSWSSRNLEDSDGSVTGSVFLGREITAEKAAEKQAEIRLEEMKFLTEKAMKFVEIRSEDKLFDFVVEGLEELVDNSIVIVNSMDNEASLLKVRSFRGSDGLRALLKNEIVVDPAETVFELVGDKPREKMLSGRLSRVEGGLYELIFHKIPKAAANDIEKKLSIDNIYAIGFAWEGQLFGSANIITRNGFDIENFEIIEAFINQASVTLQRSYAEKELIVAKLEAERANRAKSRFLANMSHEIRTPLNGMLGMTEVALRSELNPVQRTNIGMAYDSGKNLLRIVTDILDLSKIEAGEMNLVSEEFSLRKTITSIRNNMVVLAKKKGLKFVVKIHSKVPDKLIGDSFRLGQVLQNLVSNAIKFTDDGEVRIAIDSDPEIPTGKKDEISLRFSVCDTGIGIPDDKIDLIFENYQQIDSSTKHKKGTGLGIAIADNIIILMNSKIKVKSKVGFGSEFFFTLRLKLANMMGK
jgi:PAS domain S-box-containing protein